MEAPDRQQQLRHALKTFGDARSTTGRPDGDPDYVASLELTEADVPQLLAIAREWLEPLGDDFDPDDRSIYTSVHAWCGPAQIGAEQAIGLLIEMSDAMDEAGDDFQLEEFPDAFALIAPTSIEPLSRALGHNDHRNYSRSCFAHSLERVSSDIPMSASASSRYSHRNFPASRTRRRRSTGSSSRI
jgi:hypothetical protein